MFIFICYRKTLRTDCTRRKIIRCHLFKLNIQDPRLGKIITFYDIVLFYFLSIIKVYLMEWSYFRNCINFNRQNKLIVKKCTYCTEQYIYVHLYFDFMYMFNLIEVNNCHVICNFHLMIHLIASYLLLYSVFKKKLFI